MFAIRCAILAGSRQQSGRLFLGSSTTIALRTMTTGIPPGLFTEREKAEEDIFIKRQELEMQHHLPEQKQQRQQAHFSATLDALLAETKDVVKDETKRRIVDLLMSGTK